MRPPPRPRLAWQRVSISSRPFCNIPRERILRTSTTPSTWHTASSTPRPIQFWPHCDPAWMRRQLDVPGTLGLMPEAPLYSDPRRSLRLEIGDRGDNQPVKPPVQFAELLGGSFYPANQIVGTGSRHHENLPRENPTLLPQSDCCSVYPVETARFRRQTLRQLLEIPTLHDRGCLVHEISDDLSHIVPPVPNNF